MEYMGLGCYEGFYRLGKTFQIGDGESLNLDVSGRKHKGILIRPLSTVQRSLDIQFYGTPFNFASNIARIALTFATGTFNSPYILPCRVRSVSAPVLENQDNRFSITLLN